MSQRVIFMLGFPALWIVLWGLVAAVSIGTRPPLPGTELHTLAMAWDMWQRGDFLLPDLTSDQADTVYPLYLWLINGTWALFGISDVWPRLLPPALGLGCTVMIAALCRVIWPGWAGLGALAGTMAMGMIGWLVFASIAGSDMLFILCILIALWGLVTGWRRGTWDGFLLLGLGIGFGFLANGLSILIHVLPVALLTPVWAPALGWADTRTAQANGEGVGGTSGWQQWYVRLGISLSIGMILIAAWVVPAVMGSGNGEGLAASMSIATRLVLGSAVFVTNGTDVAGAWGQQWWLYLLALGFSLLPWLVWPTAWRAIGGLWPLLKDGGGRFCLLWLVPGVALYALLPGARAFDAALHVPPLAMIAAYLLYLRMDPEMARQVTERRFGNGEAVLGILIALGGLLLVVVPLSGGLVALPWWIEGVSGAWGLVLVVMAAIVAYGAPRMVIFRATLVMISMALVVLIGMLAASPLLKTQADIDPPANHLRQVLNQGVAVAFVGATLPYGHVMDFPARLEQPLAMLDPEDSIGVVAWAAGHEGGQIAVVMDQLLMGGKPAAIFPYMGQYLVFWPTEIIAEHPAIVVGPTP